MPTKSQLVYNNSTKIILFLFAQMSFISYLCDMGKIREVITYKSFFDDFFREQSPKVRTKIIKVLDIIEQLDRIPITYLKYIEGTDGLFEIRVQLVPNLLFFRWQ